jgi:hypothetical protein
MSNRESLIARKQTVRREIEQTQRELNRLRLTKPPTPARRLRTLEERLERLMTEEYNLRLAIDQSQ